MLTEEQTNMRQHGIGASEIAAICGLNRYRSALDVYLSKTEPGEAQESDNESMEWGNRLESVLAEKYAETHKVALFLGETTTHPNHPWILGTPDRLILDEDAKVMKGVELKTAGLKQAWRWGEGDEVPEEYLVQCHWYMMLFECPWDLAILIGGQKYLEYSFQRDLDLEKRLFDIGHDFWFEHVLKHIPPAPDASESAAKALTRIYPKDRLDLLPSTFEVEEWAAKLREREKTLRDAESAHCEAQNHLKALIGDHQGAEGAWGRITWKAASDTSSVNYKRIAEELHPSADLIERFTIVKPGSRRFLTKWLI